MADSESTDAPPSHVNFHYIKSNAFRTIYAEGAYGGVTGRGLIQFALYNERSAIPQESVVHLTDGGLGEETILARKEGFVREVEASVVMALDDAISLRDWLSDKINVLTEINNRRAG